MADLLKEFWSDLIQEGFYPNSSFMSQCRDMSALVEFNTINLAEAGVNPNVLIDNTSYPIATNSRTDTPHAITLKTLDTENTVVRNVEEMETSYDKAASVAYGHRMALQTKCAKLAGYNWAPASNSTYTPVIAATGPDNGAGFKRLLFEDVLALRVKYNMLDMETDGAILVLSPQHETDLIVQDIKLYKAVLAGGDLFGFKTFRTSVTPIFNKTTGVKAAFGAAAAPSTDTVSSFAYLPMEVMKADGSIDVFARYKDPEQRGDLLGFQKRFIALPLRGKGLGAVYSPAAS